MNKGMVMTEDWLTPQEVSERMKVNLDIVYRWIHSGQLKAYKMGRKLWRIKQSDFDTFLKQN